MSKHTTHADNVDRLSYDEVDLLLYLYAKFGRSTKRVIRAAWETGNYSAINLNERQAATLQSLRNTRGPSWLAIVKLSDPNA